VAACGDVVKKPKLDQHHGRCHSGFDCIDCHTSFHSPAEFKTHTQCISEAEKYQKNLYKGPRTNGAIAMRGGRGGARGGSMQNGYGRQIRSQATGANHTPLGTPSRMSPITTPAVELSPPPPVTNPVAQETPKSTSIPSSVPEKKTKSKKSKTSAIVNV
ncbi:hypothetical protein BJ138DRAFT_1214820, partial [Hygrophoropsis aurantiaca]